MTALAAATHRETAAEFPAIRVAGLQKLYRKKRAVEDVSFDVAPGSVCGFVGPNGAGKTSTLRMLMGLLKPTRGTLRVLGLDPWRHSLALRQRIGYVPENHHFYAWMKVRQVLHFVSKVYRHWDSAACARLAERLSLPLDRSVKDLSRGETAKLALTIAMSHRAELLILDEPTVGLDPLIRREFTDTLLGEVKTGGCTVIFSTHILSDLEAVADTLVLMNSGRVLAADGVDALRARYCKASFLFGHPPDAALSVPGALRVSRGIREWVALFPAGKDLPAKAGAALGARDWVLHPVTLEEVYLDILGNAAGQGPATGCGGGEACGG